MLAFCCPEAELTHTCRLPPLRSLFANKSNFLSSLSLATLILLHRLLYRFFYQLKSNLQLPEAKGFRQKYPKASQLFLSPKAPSFADPSAASPSTALSSTSVASTAFCTSAI